MRITRFLRHPVAVLDNWWDEASPKRRLDSNFGNLGMLLSLIFPSLAITLRGPAPTSALVDMSSNLQVAMCACIFLGCSMKLHGALSGHRFWFPKTTLKRCYAFGYSGAPIAFVGLVTYGWYILGNVPDAWALMTGLATPCFAVGILAQAFLYLLEYRRIDHNERRITDRTIEENRRQ